MKHIRVMGSEGTGATSPFCLFSDFGVLLKLLLNWPHTRPLIINLFLNHVRRVNDHISFCWTIFRHSTFLSIPVDWFRNFSLGSFVCDPSFLVLLLNPQFLYSFDNCLRLSWDLDPFQGPNIGGFFKMVLNKFSSTAH